MKNEIDPWKDNLSWNPVRDFSSLQRNVEKFFKDFLPASSSFSPKFDLEETPSHFLLRIDVPGVKKEDLNVEIVNNRLLISGERKNECQHKEGGLHVSECSYGSFERSFTLPEIVESDKLEVSHENGVLYLALPKSKEAKAKSIQIGDKPSSAFGLTRSTPQEKAASDSAQQDKQKNKDSNRVA